MHFHSGSYIGSKWTCCQKRTRQTLGCEPTYFLLTKSSSRYAETKRIETVNKLNRKSILAEDCISLAHNSTSRLTEGPSLQNVNQITPINCLRSNSCHNLVDNGFPSNFSVTQDAQMSSLVSCYTINSMSDSPQDRCFNRPERKEHFVSMDRKEHFVSMDSGCNRHQVAPLPDPDVPSVFDTFPRKRRSLINQQTSPSSPLVTATKCYIIQGRSPLGSSSREPSIDNVMPARKPSIEPRVSNTNPDVIHV